MVTTYHGEQSLYMRILKKNACATPVMLASHMYHAMTRTCDLLQYLRPSIFIGTYVSIVLTDHTFLTGSLF